MLNSNYEEESSVTSQDRPANYCDLPTVHVGKQGYADALPPADVAVAEGAAAAGRPVHVGAAV